MATIRGNEPFKSSSDLLRRWMKEHKGNIPNLASFVRAFMNERLVRGLKTKETKADGAGEEKKSGGGGGVHEREPKKTRANA
jgi:hypothetical protein